MRKLLLNVLFLAASTLPFVTFTSLHSQVIFSEDFDGISGPTGGGAGTYSFPPGWALFNVDGNTPAAAVSYVNTSWIRREDFSGSVLDSAAFSTSWYSPPGTADDWMISPPISPLPGAVLSWSAIALDPSYPDGYQVWISTTTPDPAGCLAGTKIFEITAESSVPTTRTISLDSAGFTSGTIYIAWRNNSTDEFMLKIDNILVEQPCGTLAIHTDSSDLAQTCVDPYTFAALSATGGIPPYSWDWSTSPADTNAMVTFPDDGYYYATLTDSTGCSIYRGFIVTGSPVPGVVDLEANMVVYGTFRSGFNTTVHIDATNHGCVPVSGQLQFVHDSALVYVSAVPVPDIISGDTLIWNFTNLDHDDPHLLVDVVLYTPLFSFGDTVCQTVIINPIPGDYHPVDNFRDGYCNVVVGSYDPNDIQVYPTGQCAEHYVPTGTSLTYTIRFQNTGTADAINVHILDTLDPGLDLSSVTIDGASHFMHTEVQPGNVLDFIFNDIHLPDSTTDEPGSHGYVIYEVKPMAGLASGTQVKNKAAIYFDFNPPVITNESWTTYVDSVPPCSPVRITPAAQTDIRLYPNPSSGRVDIISPEHLQGLKVCNALGQVILDLPVHATSATFDVSEWPSGMYFVKVQSGSGVVTRRLMVE